MQEGLDSKSVRFDVYTKDSNRIFDLEMQTVKKENLPKRARYYQSAIDMDNLNAGFDYDELKDGSHKQFHSPLSKCSPSKWNLNQCIMYNS